MHLFAHRAQGIITFGRHRFLKPVDARFGIEPVSKAHRGRHIIVTVGIDQDLHFGTDRRTNGGDNVTAQLFAIRRNLAGDIAGVIGDHL